LNSNKPYSPIRIIFSGGGTGGHIYPAIAVANKIREMNPESEILFVGAKGKMEMTKVPQAGYDIIGLWISGFHRRLTLQNLLFPVKVLVSIFKSRKILNDFKPQVVAGFGGYASSPMMLAATQKRLQSLKNL
jgi:UDP-N-acetylglucosamine--N-acetylmuramyl-(pentapeptide) pyrophosphoryl-undecaprenol N-acetylglucosamine transferase